MTLRTGLTEIASALRLAARYALLALTPKRRAVTPAELDEVVIIGAYGGDHVGDTAILGGVLLTLHQRSATARATVLSHRPAHTERLAAGLETPVALRVEPYEPAASAAALDRASALVLGGGPLMDLPLVLLRHLIAVQQARRRGVPILAERIGLGPFSRAPSRWAARRILLAAGRVSLRSRAGAADPLAAGLKVEVGRDPAFDYLATRHSLTRLTAGERASADALLAEGGGKLSVGINLRPIRHLWSERGEAYSRAAYDGFLDRFADGLVAAARAVPLRFVFFPMNPIEFGLNDLAAAAELERRLDGRVELRVWRDDPGVDGLLYLLRRLDAVIAMRLHAVIFSLSQSLPVLGIDYYPGQGGKVEELFADLERPDDVRRIDQMTAEWLSRSLLERMLRDAAGPRRGGK